jgi:HlyD family secretion protein
MNQQAVFTRANACVHPTSKSNWKLLGAVLIYFSSLSACNSNAEPSSEVKTQPATVTRTAVQVIGASQGVLSTSRSVSASLNAATDSNVVAEASGRVLQILKRAGASVKAGETILQLEAQAVRNSLEDARLALASARVNLRTLERQNPEDARQAKLRFSSSQTALDDAARVVKANIKLYALGGVSLIEVQNAQSNLRQAQAEVEAARSGLARATRAGSEGLEAQQIAVAQAQNRVLQLEADLARASVKAPFAGEIVEIFVESGEYASAGNRVVRLIDPSSLKLVFQVPVSDADLLKAGSPLQIAFKGKRLAAKVSEDARVPSENRLVRLRGRMLPNQNLSGLGVGMTTRLEYSLKLAEGVLLPSAALRADGQKYFVYLVKNNVAGRVAVRVQAESAGRVAITGIPAGASVVYPVPSALEPGAFVTVVKP